MRARRRAVTASPTAAAGVRAAETLERADTSSAAVVGAGSTAPRPSAWLPRPVVLRSRGSRRQRASRPLQTSSVTRFVGSPKKRLRPRRDHRDAGRERPFARGSLRPGQHVSLMGADGPGKAEIATEEFARARVSATTGTGEPRRRARAAAVEAGLLGRDDVTQLGDVLTGAPRADGTRSHAFSTRRGWRSRISPIALAARSGRSNWTSRGSSSSGATPRAADLGVSRSKPRRLEQVEQRVAVAEHRPRRRASPQAKPSTLPCPE